MGQQRWDNEDGTGHQWQGRHLKHNECWYGTWTKKSTRWMIDKHQLQTTQDDQRFTDGMTCAGLTSKNQTRRQTKLYRLSQKGPVK